MEEGFCNWKKALEKLEEHDRSEMHREAVLKQSNYNPTSVIAQINQQHSQAQVHHRLMLLKLLSSIRFLAQQGGDIWKMSTIWMVICINCFYFELKIAQS